MSAQDASLPVTNTLFPPPPIYFKAFTTANLARAKGKARAELLESSEKGETPGDALPNKELLAALEKPRAEWIREEKQWMCFGQMYTVDPVIPTAASIGLPPLIDPDEPPQTSLPPLLHSFLHTLLLLLDALTNTARIPGELEEKGWAHEGDQYIQHMTNLAATIMVSVNQLRSVQAESTLVLLMERQLAARREQTASLRSKCHEIAGRLRALRGDAELDGFSEGEVR